MTVNSDLPLSTPFFLQNLPAHQLIPSLVHFLQAYDAKITWQVCWLENQHQPVIGLLPKCAWTVYPLDSENLQDYRIIRSQRHYSLNKTDNIEQTVCYQTTEYSQNMMQWCDELVSYNHKFADKEPSTQHSHPFNVYHHGLMGFVGYDISAHALSPSIEPASQPAIGQAPQPCAFFGHYDIYLIPAHSSTQNDTTNTGWQLIGKKLEHDNADADNERAYHYLSHCLEAFDAYLQTQADKDNSHLCCSQTMTNPPPLYLQPVCTQALYQQAFAQTQAYLYAGDCYQINLTQPWIGQLNEHALVDYLPRLHAHTQAPYAGYLYVQHPNQKISIVETDAIQPYLPNFELLSCSPELFLRFTTTNEHTHYVCAKPIKGTIPRGQSPDEDQNNKQQLADSEKDCAENVMIVDLLRNDLGKYAKTGTVHVPSLFAIESFSNVHHLVSTIEAELKPDTHPLQVLFGSVPAGSITGTPKKRAVEIINELEYGAHGYARGAYCGSLGFLNFDGTGEFNVLIRTLQAVTTPTANTSSVSLWAGGGITVASQSQAEYQECWDKVGNLLSILAQSQS
ncbi:anthranilate synthase component I family protein [Psychrobacter sp. I-STPA6b]|uniref:anthranilate synthase component I family protein n=1 Tax=Psychrobacter sp. I-STPA6b TaxID=2585718 RepID=UPI001D0CBA55|nr:anthranilate synthase component I family protein [Psychrobacter sp. I-STPA6b]